MSRPHKFKLTPEGKRTIRPFCAFAREHLYSEDIDPVYPVLKWIQRDMETEVALWSTFLYVSWYNLSSGLEVFTAWPEKNEGILNWLKTERFPTGVERRNLRGGRVHGHIQSYFETLADYETQYDFWFEDIPHRRAKTLQERHENWLQVNENIRKLFGNGRWASYKMLEILERVNGFSSLMEAPDMGHAHSSGPRKGLARFYGHVEGQTSDAIQLLDDMGLDLQHRVSRALGHEVEIEHLETMLCDWNSLAKGKYVVGHDIDQMLEQANKARREGNLSKSNYKLIMKARRAALPHEYLGELNGWDSGDKERDRHFVKRGKILIRKSQPDKHWCDMCQERMDSGKIKIRGSKR